MTRIITTALAFLLLITLAVAPAQAERRIRDFCRVKGQEENTLQGMGLVVGLQGTGDGDAKPTLQAMAKLMNVMGSPLPQNVKGLQSLDDLEAKNVAMVWVTATVPASGAREGGKLDCKVSSIGSAKSLAGGYLITTPLLGPRPGSQTVFAIAQGNLHMDDPKIQLSARVHGGCRVERDFFNAYTSEEEQFVTLVIQPNHAAFETAYDIAEVISRQPDFIDRTNSTMAIAKAIDQANILVRIPPQYQSDPVSFISNVLNTKLAQTPGGSTVVINERSGVVVVGSNVELGSLAISHRNLVIQAGTRGSETFVKFSPNTDDDPKLTDLISALNALKVPPQDVIDIIKTIDRSGELHGQLIIE